MLCLMEDDVFSQSGISLFRNVDRIRVPGKVEPSQGSRARIDIDSHRVPDFNPQLEQSEVDEPACLGIMSHVLIRVPRLR